MTYTDEEIRHMAIELLTAKTARDKQSRIGASNLSNQCNRCLAANFMGVDRSSTVADRAWMGRVLGTSFHSTFETRINEAKANGTAEMIGLPANVMAERHIIFCTIDGYGEVGGTIDLDLGDTVGDYKGSTRKKIALLIDFLQRQRGLPPIFGRRHRVIAESGKTMISEAEYEKAMSDMAYKVQGYAGQATLYMHGRKAKRAALIFVARDGTGVFDNPAGDRYLDPTAVHDVYVLSFDYDQAYAEALIARGQAIWDQLQAGFVPADFEPNAQCFVCGKEVEESLKAVDIEATMGVAA